MKSTLFYKGHYKSIEKHIKAFLNNKQKSELGISGTHRTAGDKIPEVLSNEIKNILSKFITSFELPTSSKSMANYEFTDKEGLKYYINVITHKQETHFNMPNITSVDRLKKLYNNDRNVFVVLLITYSASKPNENILDVRFIPIEFYSWSCLTLGALGSGQIQIKNASDITEIAQNSRKEWMLEFFDRLDEFYVNEADKTVKRIKNLLTLRIDWKKKKDAWKE